MSQHSHGGQEEEISASRQFANEKLYSSKQEAEERYLSDEEARYPPTSEISSITDFDNGGLGRLGSRDGSPSGRHNDGNSGNPQQCDTAKGVQSSSNWRVNPTVHRKQRPADKGSRGRAEQQDIGGLRTPPGAAGASTPKSRSDRKPGPRNTRDLDSDADHGAINSQNSFTKSQLLRACEQIEQAQPQRIVSTQDLRSPSQSSKRSLDRRASGSAIGGPGKTTSGSLPRRVPSHGDHHEQDGVHEDTQLDPASTQQQNKPVDRSGQRASPEPWPKPPGKKLPASQQSTQAWSPDEDLGNHHSGSQRMENQQAESSQSQRWRISHEEAAALEAEGGIVGEDIHGPNEPPASYFEPTPPNGRRNGSHSGRDPRPVQSARSRPSSAGQRSQPKRYRMDEEDAAMHEEQENSERKQEAHGPYPANPELDSILGDFKAETLSAMAEANNNLRADVERSNTDLRNALENKLERALARFDAVWSKKLGVIDEQLFGLQGTVAELESQNRKLFGMVEELQNKCKVIACTKAEEVATAVAAEEWDRKPRTDVLKVNAKEMVTKQAVANGLREWLDGVGLHPDDWEIQGAHGLGKNFTLAFHGTPMHATRMVNECFAALRKGHDQWEEFSADAPGARHTVQIFVSKDQSPKTRATVALGKRAMVVAKDLAKEAGCKDPIHLIKFQGYITRDWKPFIWICPKPDRSFTVRFVDQRLPEGFQKKEFTQRLADAANTRLLGEFEKLKWV